MPPVIETCPSCSGRLEIRELNCPRCDLQIRGHFPLPARPERPALGLTAAQLAFLRIFVASRGNLSDVERTLGVSYPTVRAKVDELVAALVTAPAGEEPTRPPAAPRETAARTGAADEAPRSRRDVLEAVAAGRLSAAEAATLLRNLTTSAPASGGTRKPKPNRPPRSKAPA
jgi:hypothetical protein